MLLQAACLDTELPYHLDVSCAIEASQGNKSKYLNEDQIRKRKKGRGNRKTKVK